MQGTWLRRIVIGLALLLPATLDVAADSVRLHSDADVSDGSVLLKDVAELKGATAESMGDLVVANFDEGKTGLAVTLTSLRSMLTKRNVNWGRLSLGGYSRCTVSLEAPAGEVEVASPVVDIALTLNNPDKSADLATAVTLEDRVVQMIQSHVDGDPADMVIRFSESDSRRLAKADLTDRYVIEPLASSSPGRIPVLIRQWRGDELVGTHHVRADVALRRLAVVAIRNVRRDAAIGRDDVEVREIMLSDGRGMPSAKLSDVVGKRAAGNLRKGSAVYPGSLRSPLLVRKRELMTVYSRSGGIEIRTSARAMEDGEQGQLVKVRRNGQRDEFVVRVTGRRRGEALADEPANERMAS